jgi:hypothetical protein
VSTLAGELENLRSIIDTLPIRRVLPANQMRPTHRVLDRLLNALDVVPALPEARLEKARREVIAAQKRGIDPADLPLAVLNDAVWLLWPDSSDGVNRASLRRAILVRLGARKSMLRRLIDVWLLQFSGGDDSFVEVGRHIERHLGTAQKGILSLWRESHRAYDLFDAKAGPDKFAARLLEESEAQTLAACRLDGPARATSGYLRAVHFALSTKLPKRLVQADGAKVLPRGIRFYAPDNALRFDERAPNGAMADALVAPWIKTQHQPSESLRSDVLAYLRQFLGDPRVDARQRWAGASDPTRQTVRGWLSKLSLDAFFNVVGQFANNAGMDHQWKAREAFWSTCLRKDFIQDSWLVLGDNVVRAVAHNRELRGSHGYLADGNANHSVLLMRIGQLTFAEWSHNGKLRAWPVDWKKAPALFGRNYYRSELTESGLQFPPPENRQDLTLTSSDGVSHVADIWQGRVAALLRKREGLTLRPTEWQVR